MDPWKIHLSPPEMSTVERDNLTAAFDSGWIAPAGPDLNAFEHELCAFTGAAAAAALSSGTAGLHLALMALGVKAGDDVLISTTTFAAPAFAATYVGARPCFVDIDDTWHLDPDLLEAELQTRAARGRLPGAVVAVNMYGAVANQSRIAEICQRFDVPLVEDGAESLGATLQGRHAGRFGRIGVLSFNGNKIVNTGGGGAIISDDEALVARCRFLATQARVPVAHYEHEEVGYNYRLGNLNAAVGRGQLVTLPARLRERGRVRTSYENAFAGYDGIGFQPPVESCEPNHWLTVITVEAERFGATPERILAALTHARIEARPGFKPMHLQPVFAGAPRVGGDRSNQLFATSLCLPSSGRLTNDEVTWICDIALSARS